MIARFLRRIFGATSAVKSADNAEQMDDVRAQRRARRESMRAARKIADAERWRDRLRGRP